jgi:hypothetical protein
MRPCSGVVVGWVCLLAWSGCGPTVAGGSEDETGGALSSPIYGDFETTDLGVRVPVCVPLDGACLRLSVLINTQQRLDEAVVHGQLVGPSCEPDSEPSTAVQAFHGDAFTGHGVLWLIGDAQLDDGTALPLDVEAVQGECI